MGIGFIARLDTSRHTHTGISQQTSLTVEDDDPAPFDELWEVLANLANLIVLSVGKPIRWGDVSGQVLLNSGSKESVIIIYNREPLAPDFKEIPAQDMLFTLPTVRERFGDIVGRWLHRPDSFDSLFRLYFGTIQSPFMYVEQRFLNMFQALESYHRRTCVPDVAGESKHRARTQRILVKHEGKDREWLEKRISWRNEQTAEDRIADLVKDLDAAWLLTPDEIKGATILRNYYTHYDETREGLPEKENRVTRLINLGEVENSLRTDPARYYWIR